MDDINRNGLDVCIQYRGGSVDWYYPADYEEARAFLSDYVLTERIIGAYIENHRANLRERFAPLRSQGVGFIYLNSEKVYW